MKTHRILPVVAIASIIAGLVGPSTSSRAQAPLFNTYGGTVGYGTSCLSPNDDGSSAPVNLASAFPNGLHFFSTVHSVAYINTNGNITFSGAVPTYTPRAFPIANQPMIAPYWGDVDIRYTGGYCQGSAGVTCNPCTPCHNPSENGVWWHLEPGLMVITWDRVGYYSCHMNLRMSFQLILTAAGCGGAGDFDVEFRYNRCEWETGDASGGSGGFGGTEAQAGFDAGNETDFVALPGSLAPGIANTLCTSSNVGETGVWRFQIRSGSIICPDAGQPCDTGLLGVCAEGRTHCVGSGTQCIPDVVASEEICDALDNDCDGEVDEGDSLCPSGQVCAGGHCVFPCTEFCGGALVCDAITGLCVEEGCIGVTCPEGQRCAAGGICVGACDGVVCPHGQVCRAGACMDLCATLTCDDCTVCENGVCVSHCDWAPCPAGTTCQDDGHCVASACDQVDCPAGFHCEGGQCVDNCTGAICPTGQTCEAGICIPIPPGLDAGPSWPDAGPGQDAGGFQDAWIPGQPDAGSGSDPDDSHPGCACDHDASGQGPLFPLALFALVALFLLQRRRRWSRASRSSGLGPI